MYEDDTPPAERRAQVLSLDRDLLKELLGQDELRELIDPGALEEVETQLRGAPRNAGRAARRAAPARRSSSRILRRGTCGAAPRRAARDHGADRRRGAPGRGRGRGTVPRRARCDAAGRAAGDIPRGRGGLAGEPRRALRQGPWPVHDRGGERPLRARRRAAAARARAGGTARPRRAPAGRVGARVVRPRRPASSSPRVPRGAPQGGRAGGGGGVRAVPAELARDRPAREPARGARPAPGAAASGLALGERGAAAARAGLPAGPARPAVRDR